MEENKTWKMKRKRRRRICRRGKKEWYEKANIWSEIKEREQ